MELAGAADAERARRARDAAYRAEAEARIGAALERSLAGFRAQVAEACTAVLAHIQSGRPLREGTVERLRRTIRRFRALNFVDDDTLAGELAAFEQACLDGLDPGAVQEAPDVRAVLTAGLQAVVEAATTELPRSVLTGRALRRFDVDTGAEDGTGDAERPGSRRGCPDRRMTQNGSARLHPPQGPMVRPPRREGRAERVRRHPDAVPGRRGAGRGPDRPRVPGAGDRVARGARAAARPDDRGARPTPSW